MYIFNLTNFKVRKNVYILIRKKKLKEPSKKARLIGVGRLSKKSHFLRET